MGKNTAVGACALNRHGLVSWFYGMLFQTTSTPARHRTQILNSVLFYLPKIEEDNAYIERIVRTEYGPMRLPTKERSLVDYMRHLDIFELSYFVEGLHEYLWLEGSPDKLLEVAKHYGVREEMQKWIDEDEDYSDYA